MRAQGCLDKQHTHRVTLITLPLMLYTPTHHYKPYNAIAQYTAQPHIMLLCRINCTPPRVTLITLALRLYTRIHHYILYFTLLLQRIMTQQTVHCTTPYLLLQDKQHTHRVTLITLPLKLYTGTHHIMYVSYCQCYVQCHSMLHNLISYQHVMHTP